MSNDAIRAVYALDLVRLADLTAGPYEREVTTTAGKVQARWSLGRDTTGQSIPTCPVCGAGPEGSDDCELCRALANTEEESDG